MTSPPVFAPEALAGLWRRSLLEWPDGRRDTTTRVHWLQGLRAFADLRQPPDLPELAQVRCRDDLSPSDCERLAQQHGFAGDLHFDGRHFEWNRRIDFQPRGALADAGSLEWRGDILVERGRDAPYVEHWHRDGADASPIAAVRLRAMGDGCRAILLRVGAHFMYARDRAVTLQPQQCLSDLVAAASADAARALIDCEISLGTVTDGEFRIRASTLPYRRDRVLERRLREHTLRLSDIAADGSAMAREWEILEREGDWFGLDIS